MAKRDLSDEEIGLIKGMLAKGMGNDEAHAYFNRFDRLFSPGRISNIKLGKYGPDVLAADAAAVDAFIANFKLNSAKHNSKIPIVGKVPSIVHGPIDIRTLEPMFQQDSNGVWRFSLGETDQHECKENFGFKHSDQWLRAVAALANNRGGYIFLGVRDKDTSPIDSIDKSYVVVGLKDSTFKDADPADFAKKIKTALDPTPRYHTATIEIDGKCIGVIYVEQHPSRPVIAACSINDKFKEGDIYFRYTGQSVRIKYSDLRTILDARDEQARRDILPMVERLLALGPGKALITNLVDGTLEDGKHQIVIDPELVNQIKFVKEGDFTQKDGAPTLKLVGNVTALDGKSQPVTKLIRDKIGEDDIVRNFLERQLVQLPESYIRQGIDLQRKWLPIFYYVKMAETDPAAIADKIEAEKTSHKFRQSEIVKRLRKKMSAKTAKPASRAQRQYATQIEQGILPSPQSAKEALLFADALTCISQTKASIDDLLATMKITWELVTASELGSIGRVSKAICRIDELFFG